MIKPFYIRSVPTCFRSDRLRWVEAVTPAQQVSEDERIYESWGEYHISKRFTLFKNIIMYYFIYFMHTFSLEAKFYTSLRSVTWFEVYAET